jgi:hypothetical protein
MTRWSWRIEFKPADIWIGVYWERRPWLHLWVCLLPMVPIHLWRKP